MAKPSAVQRQSEGIEVPRTLERSGGTNAVRNNAAGGKGPCGDQAGFLGHHLHKRLSGVLLERTGKRLYFLHRWPSHRSMKRVRERIKELTLRSQCHADIRTVIASVNTVLRGWGNYFKSGNAARQFISVDDHVVRRLRALRFKRKGRHLRPGDARGWTREYFEHLGLYRLRGTISYLERPFWTEAA
jgi:hypothetical protein